jgi:UDP-N-acetylmuramoylalanine--D-glutamate ligase
LPSGGVVVLGAGTSGAAATRALLTADVAPVWVVDSRDTPALRATADELRANGADVALGVTDPAAVTGAALVVTSPGLSLAHPLLAAALAASAPVISEPELAWRLNAGHTRWVAITGTNGKTTTTQLAAACLNAPAIGNIGPPLCDALAVAEPPPVAVVELSSFQLRFTDGLRAAVGVLLNVAPDHLDWHPDLADYEASKARVWAHQLGQDAAVVYVDDPGADRVAGDHPPGARFVPVTLQQPREGGVGVAGGCLVSRIADAAGEIVAVDRLPRTHPAFVADAACAAAAALAVGSAQSATGTTAVAPPTPGVVGTRLATVRGGPHRLEHVGDVAGVAYINDSKATNPHAAAAALATFDSVVWIAGGLDKGLDLTAVASLLPGRVRGIVAVGQAAEQVAAVGRAAGVPVETAGTVAAAVPAAARRARPGDVVLMAPGCASMDQFRDYAERGEAFRVAVAQWAETAGGRRPAPAPTPSEADDGR